MSIRILTGDCLEVLRTLPAASAHCCVTSPPYYGLRSYGIGTENGEIGLEQTPDAYVAKLVAVFREVRRVLADDGTLWLNIGDSYNSGTQNNHGRSSGLGNADRYTEATPTEWGGSRPHIKGLKHKDLIGIPWMLAFALRADGWYLRSEIIWHKPNPMPESVRDRCTKAHEYVFLLSKQARYFYDAEAIAEPVVYAAESRVATPKNAANAAIGKPTKAYGEPTGNDNRNKRSVWTIATHSFAEAHFATFPPELAETCIKAGCPQGGTVLDCFGGAGTTGLVADRLQRNAVMIELNPAYAEMSRRRVMADAGLFAEVAE